MKTKELKEKGAIFFERIEEGFSEYKDAIIVLEEEEAVEHFKKLIQEYGEENAYADFYYYKLSEEAREKINGILKEDELEYLRGLSVESSDDIVFLLDERLLQIIVKSLWLPCFWAAMSPCSRATGYMAPSVWKPPR